jgi:hypothetical protein
MGTGSDDLSGAFDHLVDRVQLGEVDPLGHVAQ